jgi:hypothetical protein
MTTSTATTEFDAREALRQHFEKNALTAFENFIELLRQRDLYLHTLRKIEQGADLTGELPELKLVNKTVAKKVVKQLIRDTEKAAALVWESPLKIFTTSARSSIDELSLLPIFDALYTAKSKSGAVKITVKTWRRNLTVAVEGNESACYSVYGQLVMAGMRRNFD